jgi:hypothetical protein
MRTYGNRDSLSSASLYLTIHTLLILHRVELSAERRDGGEDGMKRKV